MPSPSPCPTQRALAEYFGIGLKLGPLILARFQIPYWARVKDLTEPQIASLTAYLSSTTTSDLPLRTPVLDIHGKPERMRNKEGVYEDENAQDLTKQEREEVDRLRHLEIETDLKRKINGQIQHLFRIGTHRGKRYVQDRILSG